MPVGQKFGGRKPGTPNKLTASLMEAAGVYTADALITLAAIMLDKQQPAPARVGAAIALLDRGHGKPSQALQLTGKDGANLIPAAQPPERIALAILNLLEAARKARAD